MLLCCDCVLRVCVWVLLLLVVIMVVCAIFAYFLIVRYVLDCLLVWLVVDVCVLCLFGLVASWLSCYVVIVSCLFACVWYVALVLVCCCVSCLCVSCLFSDCDSCLNVFACLG